MSDAARKDFTTQAKEEITPNTQKSTVDKVQENITDTADSAARAVGNDSDKSTSQSLADKTTGKTDEAKNDTMTDKVKSAIGLDK